MLSGGQIVASVPLKAVDIIDTPVPSVIIIRDQWSLIGDH
jgi:hypothetical protein